MTKEQIKLEQVKEIDLKLLRESAMNPRMDYGNGDLEKSIRDQGVLVPLIVRETTLKPGSYEVIDGARRLRAAKKAGLTKAPSIVRVIPDSQIPMVMFDANVHKNLKPAELGNAFMHMSKTGGMTHAQIAKKAEISETEVSMMMHLTLLPTEVQRLINDGFISRDIYKELVKLIGFPMMDWAKEKLVAMHAFEADKERYHRKKEDVVIEPLTRSDWSSALGEKLRKTQEDSLILDHLGPKLSGPAWFKEFDDKDCKKCKKKVELHGNDEVCLDNDCWKPKARVAKREVQEQKVLEKADPKRVVDVGNLPNGSFEDLSDANFNVSACDRCPDKKKGKKWGGNITACMYPACYNQMDGVAEKEVEKRLKDFNINLIATRDLWLSKYKPVGLDKDICQVIILNYARDKPKKKDDLETFAVNAIVRRVSNEFRGFPDEDDMKGIRSLSFMKDIALDMRKPELVPQRREKEEKKEIAPGCEKKKAGRPKKAQDNDGDDEGENDE